MQYILIRALSLRAGEINPVVTEGSECWVFLLLISYQV